MRYLIPQEQRTKLLVLPSKGDTQSRGGDCAMLHKA